MLKAIFVSLAMLLAALWITAISVSVVNYIGYSRTDAWLQRARDAGNPAQVAQFLTEYKDQLYQNDLVTGRFYSFWKYPATDMETYVKIVDGLVVRANALSIQEPTMDSYQMGLINLEKDMGDVDAEAFNVWQMNMGGIFWIIGAYAGWILVIIGWVIACAYQPERSYR